MFAHRIYPYNKTVISVGSHSSAAGTSLWKTGPITVALERRANIVLTVRNGVTMPALPRQKDRVLLRRIDNKRAVFSETLGDIRPPILVGSLKSGNNVSVLLGDVVTLARIGADIVELPANQTPAICHHSEILILDGQAISEGLTITLGLRCVGTTPLAAAAAPEKARLPAPTNCINCRRFMLVSVMFVELLPFSENEATHVCRQRQSRLEVDRGLMPQVVAFEVGPVNISA